MTYYIKIDGKYLSTYYTNGKEITHTITDPETRYAMILDYNEAVQVAYELNIRNGKVDYAVMIEAYEEQNEADDEADDRDEYQKKADAAAEYADDHRDDELL